MALKITCLDRIRDNKTSNIKYYVIRDEYGRINKVAAEDLKLHIRNGVCVCENLKLTADNRLIAIEPKNEQVNSKFTPSIFGIHVKNIEIIEKPTGDYYQADVYMDNNKLGKWIQYDKFIPALMDGDRKWGEFDFDKSLISKQFSLYRDYKEKNEKFPRIISEDDFIMDAILLTEYYNLYNQALLSGYTGIVVVTDICDYNLRIIGIKSESISTTTGNIHRLIDRAIHQIEKQTSRLTYTRYRKAVVKTFLSLNDFKIE